MLPYLRLILASCGLLLLTAGLQGGEQVFRHEYREHSDTFVEVQSVFGPVGKQGSLPYRITIRNHSGKPRVWTVTLSEGNQGRPLSTKSVYRIEVENGTEVVREVMLSFAPAFLTYGYRNLNIEVSAPGLPTESRQTGEQTPDQFPMIAMSQALAERSLTRLDNEVRSVNSSNPYFAKLFEPGHLPLDWIGYSGLDILLLDDAAWRGLTSAQRQALVAWIRLGGRLDLYSETPLDPTTLGLPLASPGGKDVPATLSLGSIYFRTWDGREVPNSHLAFYRDAAQASSLLDEEFQNKWELRSGFGSKEFNPTLVFLLLLAFAILVAPVNLFYLAKPGRRHRLFITTPIISVATCLLIVLLILFIDGIGGKGHRVVLADLQPGPGETRAYVTQEQISRTGVMVNSGFETDRPFEINPVNLPPSHFNPLSQSGRRSATFETNGGRHEGEFFLSRSEQAFTLRAAEPGRARIEANGIEDGKPVLISNLSQEITDFLYRDSNGRLWAAPAGTSVAPGQRIPLEPAKTSSWPDWMKDSVDLFSKSRQNQIRRLTEPHRFFAQVRDPEAFALPTHPSLRWEKTALILTGTPSGEITPAP
ncbi:MAG: hypothetical protein JNJ70_11315 [Verrucomicrobiales bacterium]|nr:hypothetical protein [Verrucomicrobiales bacterium]